MRTARLSQSPQAEKAVSRSVVRRSPAAPHRSKAEPPGAAVPSPLASHSSQGRSIADPPFFLIPTEGSMTKRACKRMVREGAFDDADFDDGKIRRLPIERRLVAARPRRATTTASRAT